MTSPELYRRVTDIVGEALDLRGEARSSFLERACGSDAELRLQVDRLLDQATPPESRGEGSERVDLSAHFFRTAATAMRRILVDHERQRRAQKRIPAEAKIPIELGAEPIASKEMDILKFDDVLGRLAKLSSRQARIVELRYFGGLTESQVAEVLDISRRTVTREMRVARLWLRDQMSS